MITQNKPILTQRSEMRIGKVNYIVTSHYKENGRETADQKFMRYVNGRVAAELKSAEKAVK